MRLYKKAIKAQLHRSPSCLQLLRPEVASRTLRPVLFPSPEPKGHHQRCTSWTSRPETRPMGTSYGYLGRAALAFGESASCSRRGLQQQRHCGARPNTENLRSVIFNGRKEDCLSLFSLMTFSDPHPCTLRYAPPPPGALNNVNCSQYQGKHLKFPWVAFQCSTIPF